MPSKLPHVDSPALFQFITKFGGEWFEGFDEKDLARYPTTSEKQQIARYPIAISIVNLTYMPLLMPHFSAEGDEKQCQYAQHWFNNYYYRNVDLLLKKAVQWGFAVGERVIETEEIDGKPYWFHVNTFAPEPYNCTLEMSEKRPELAAFKYSDYRVERYQPNGNWKIPGMVYMHFRGNEISLPYGDSIYNDLWYAYQLVQKTWTTSMLYQVLHTPFLKYFYAQQQQGDSDNKASDAGRTQAITDVEKLKHGRAAVIPMVRNDKGEFIRAGDLETEAPPDREPSFLEKVKTLNTMMYVAALIPERLIEQFKDTGSYSMVETQKDFYTAYIIKPRLRTLGNLLQTWFLNPMLEANFGKIDCRVNLQIDDKLLALYYDIVNKAVTTGSLLAYADMQEILKTVGVPALIKEHVPEVETQERQRGDVVEMAQTKRSRDRERIEAYVNKVVKVMNRSVREIKADLYNELKPRLEAQQGRIALKIDRLYKNGVPKRVDLQNALQIPSNVYSGAYEYILRAWQSGQEFHCREAKVPVMDKPSREIADKLRTLDDVFTGSQYVAGEGELLERRLYRIMATVRVEDALAKFNEEFKAYIEQTLPTRVMNLIHDANKYGTRDFARYLQLVVAKEQKG